MKKISFVSLLAYGPKVLYSALAVRGYSFWNQAGQFPTLDELQFASFWDFTQREIDTSSLTYYKANSEWNSKFSTLSDAWNHSDLEVCSGDPIGMVKSLLRKEISTLYQMCFFRFFWVWFIWRELGRKLNAINENNLFYLEKSKSPLNSGPTVEYKGCKKNESWLQCASSPLSSIFWQWLFYVETLSALAVLSARKGLLIC